MKTLLARPHNNDLALVTSRKITNLMEIQPTAFQKRYNNHHILTSKTTATSNVLLQLLCKSSSPMMQQQQYRPWVCHNSEGSETQVRAASLAEHTWLHDESHCA